MLTIFASILGTGVLGCLGWVFQRALSLGTRVTVIETRQEDVKELFESKLEDIISRLTRIERGMNGKLGQ